MKNFMKIFPKIFTKRLANAGMSQPAMILAVLMSLVILGAAGGGMASMMNSQQEVTNEIWRKAIIDSCLLMKVN